MERKRYQAQEAEMKLYFTDRGISFEPPRGSQRGKLRSCVIKLSSFDPWYINGAIAIAMSQRGWCIPKRERGSSTGHDMVVAIVRCPLTPPLTLRLPSANRSILLTMPIIVLPPEVISEIFGHCSEGALAKCALISKSYLDLSRSHLYRTVVFLCTALEYTMSCPSMPQIFSHTKHISFQNFPGPYAPFLREVYRLGRVETITQQCPPFSKKNWSFMEECLEALLEFLSLPSLPRCRFSIVGKKLAQTSKFIPSILASSKLQDLSLFENGDVMRFPSVYLENLDTLRSSACYSHAISIDYSTIRRRAFQINFHPYERPETFMGMWVASTPNHSTTHLALDFQEIEELDEGGSLITPTIPIFMDIPKLSCLTSLTFEISTPSGTLKIQLDFLYPLIEHVPQSAPLRAMHIIIQSFQNIEKDNFNSTDSAWERIPKMVKHRFPNCQLSVHFGCFLGVKPFDNYVTHVESVDEDGNEEVEVFDCCEDDNEDDVARFVVPNSIAGVDRVLDDNDGMPGKPFFSGEPTDYLHD